MPLTEKQKRILCYFANPTFKPAKVNARTRNSLIAKGLLQGFDMQTYSPTRDGYEEACELGLTLLPEHNAVVRDDDMNADCFCLPCGSSRVYENDDSAHRACTLDDGIHRCVACGELIGSPACFPTKKK